VKKFKVDWFGGYIYRYTPRRYAPGCDVSPWPWPCQRGFGLRGLALAKKSRPKSCGLACHFIFI